MKTNRQKQSGFTLVEIMIVVAIIGLLAAIAIPNFARARAEAQKRACISNLRQLDGAKEQWALENKRVTGDTVAESDVIAYLKAAPVCPASGSYSPNAVGTPPVCSKSADGHTL